MIPEKKKAQSTELQRQTGKEMVICVFLLRTAYPMPAIPLSLVTNAKIQLGGSSVLFTQEMRVACFEALKRQEKAGWEQ